MVIEGGGFPIRDKLLRIVEGADRPKGKKNGKLRKADADSKKSDVLEVTSENIKASRARLKGFDEAVELLRRTKGLIEKEGDLANVHSGVAGDSLIKLIVS